MNKNIKNLIFTIILAYVLSFYLPWWSVMIAAIISGFIIPLKKGAVFFIPFVAVALLWIIQSYILSNANDFILAEKIAVLLKLNGNTTLLILITGVIGGLAAGISGVLGKQISTI
ncbi:MAG: hypothetical protein DA407_04770, partial [Bacteroidetes bacterium]